jgi:hypothetical protein
VSAKGMSRCLGEASPARTTSRTRRKTAPGRLETATGEAECAMTQIVHFCSSRALECWWAAKLYAANSVSSRHKQAICFVKTDRMKASRAV